MNSVKEPSTWNPEIELRPAAFRRLSNEGRYLEFQAYIAKLRAKPFGFSPSESFREAVRRFPPKESSMWQKVEAGTLVNQDALQMKQWKEELDFKKYEQDREAANEKLRREIEPEPDELTAEVLRASPVDEEDEDAVYAVQLQELIDRGDPVDFERDWEWAYAHFSIKGIEPKSAPSASAWKLLRFAQNHQAKFIEKFLAYFEKKRNNATEDRKEIEEDQRTQFATLDRFARQVFGNVEVTVQELLSRFPDELIECLRSHGWEVSKSEAAA